jgi:CelD/BcsL family acetyltransferase involved in cellulose biosynthesis
MVAGHQERIDIGCSHAEALAGDGWEEFLQLHPCATVFHTRGWLQALERTYGYRPRILTIDRPGGGLRSALVFCEVDSWCTGHRLVSLPFSDHCEALIDSPADAESLLLQLDETAKREQLRYVELRPRKTASLLDAGCRLTPYCDFVLHTVSLRGPLEQIFRDTHKECIQRKVRRAEREELAYSVGRDETLIHHFYKLMVRTRRRHGLPPQPLKWFQNLVRCMGESMAIHLAYQSGTPVAATLSLQFRQTLTYKYGCSDERVTNLGGHPFLFAKMFEYAKDRGMEEVDLGRSDLDEPGLIAFKDRLGGVQERIEYFRVSASGKKKTSSAPWLRKLVKVGCGCAPDFLLRGAGNLLYRHFG